MAREKVVDLVTLKGSTQALERRSSPSSRDGGDLARWAMQSPFSWKAMVGGGALMVTLGVTFSILLNWGFFGTMFLTSLMTAGSGSVFLGLVKRRGRRDAALDELRAPSASEQRVLEQRSKRILATLERAGRPQTFEAVVGTTQWTRDAVLDTLLFMKERGEVAEDLDLDTGEWVYSPSDPDSVPGSPVSLMLEERLALSERTETKG